MMEIGRYTSVHWSLSSVKIQSSVEFRWIRGEVTVEPAGRLAENRLDAMLDDDDGCQQTRHAPRVQVVAEVPATFANLPLPQSVGGKFKIDGKSIGNQKLIGNSHDSLPDIRYRAIEPRKVSHREEIDEKGEGDAVLVNDVDWRLRLHDSQPEHERREVDEREDRHFVLAGGREGN
jgi:hypothetical protein